jgi:hypothetical protein
MRGGSFRADAGLPTNILRFERRVLDFAGGAGGAAFI